MRMEARLEAIEKRLALLEAPLSNEKILRCVQCGENFLETRNPDGICEFHLEPLGDSWNRAPGVYLCCKTNSKGCVRTSHSSAHHNRYPYLAYKQWFHETLGKADEIWADLEHYDLASESEGDIVAAQIGVLKDGTSIFARAGGKLRVFENFHLPAAGVLVEDKSSVDRFAQIVLKDKTTFVVSVKATSDDDAEVVEVQMTEDKHKLILKSIQEPHVPPRDTKHPSLPNASSSGPQLDLGDIPVTRTYSQEGAGPEKVTLSLQGPLEVNSSFSSRDGYFQQYVTGYLVILNPSNAPLLISQIKSEYLQQAPNVWIQSEARPDDSLTGVRVDAAQAHKCSVQCVIKVKGEPGGDNASRARIHSSLPQPLCIRFIVEFADGTTLAIRGEKVNPKFVLPTKEQVDKDQSVKVLHWMCCDDMDSATRHYVYAYLDDNGDLAIRNSVNSSYVYSFSALRLARLGYRAKLAGETIRLIDEMTTETSDGVQFTCSVLADQDQVYGFQFQLRTRSGVAESSYGIPTREGAKGTVTILSPSPFKPSQLLHVQWTSKRLLTSSDWIAVFKRFAPKQTTEYLGESVYVKEGMEGTTNVRLPLTRGVFELRLISKGECIAKSNEFTV